MSTSVATTVTTASHASIAELVTKLRAAGATIQSDAQALVATLTKYGPQAEVILEQVIAAGQALPAPFTGYAAPVIVAAIDFLHVVTTLESWASALKV